MKKKTLLQIEKGICLNTGGNVLVDCLILNDGNYLHINDEIIELAEGDGSEEKAYDNTGENTLQFVDISGVKVKDHDGGEPLWYVSHVVPDRKTYCDRVYMRSGIIIEIDPYTIAIFKTHSLGSGLSSLMTRIGTIKRNQALLTGVPVETRIVSGIASKKVAGEASIKIELKAGVITVFHGTDGDILTQFMADAESWDAIWEGINKARKHIYHE